MYLHFLIFYYYYDVGVGGGSCGCPAKIFHARCSRLILLTNNTYRRVITLLPSSLGLSSDRQRRLLVLRFGLSITLWSVGLDGYLS